MRCHLLCQHTVTEISHRHRCQCHQVSPSVTKCHQVSPSVTKCHQVSPSVTKCHQVSPSVTKCHQVSPSVIYCVVVAAVPICSKLLPTRMPETVIFEVGLATEKMPVLRTGIYFNFTISLSMCGPPTFKQDR